MKWNFNRYFFSSLNSRFDIYSLFFHARPQIFRFEWKFEHIWTSYHETLRIRVCLSIRLSVCRQIKRTSIQKVDYRILNFYIFGLIKLWARKLWKKNCEFRFFEKFVSEKTKFMKWTSTRKVTNQFLEHNTSRHN